MKELKKVTVPAIRAMKGAQRIGMITAYDYPSARVADAAGSDVILGGDSLGMVILGYPDTLSVTVDDMVHHTRAAARGVQRARRAAGGGAGVVEHVGDGDAEGVGVAENHHAEGVADEDDVGAGSVGRLGARVVVGGDHADAGRTLHRFHQGGRDFFRIHRLLQVGRGGESAEY